MRRCDGAHGEIVKVLGFPEVKSRLFEQGLDAIGNTPEQFSAYIKSEMTKWTNVIRIAHVTAEQ